MTAKSIFLDTNILVYAHDKKAGDKNKKAQQIIQQAWNMEFHPVISVQVLQEFYVNLIRKKVPHKTAQSISLSYLAWEVVAIDMTLFEHALKEQGRWKTSYWDSMILAAARWAKTRVIWSEDFNPEQNYGGLRIENPLQI